MIQITFLKSSRVLKRVFKDQSSFNFIVPLCPLNYFLKKNEVFLGKASSVSVIKGRHPTVWGDVRLTEEQRMKENEMVHKMRIGYESIDELLRDLLTVPIR